MNVIELRDKYIKKANAITEYMIREHEQLLDDLKKQYDKELAELLEELKEV